MRIYLCTHCLKINIWIIHTDRSNLTCKFCDYENACTELHDGSQIKGTTITKVEVI